MATKKKSAKSTKKAAPGAAAKKAAAKKAPARRAAAKRPAAKRPAAKRPAAKRPAAEKAAARSAPARKARAKKASPEQASDEAERVYERRADYGSDVDTLMAKLPPSTREIVASLRDIIRKAAPEATESVKWGMPVYSQGGLFCYVAPKANRIRFGFFEQGVHLSDPDGLLVGSGENMRHVRIDSAQDIRPELFTQWVKQAVQINLSR